MNFDFFVSFIKSWPWPDIKPEPPVPTPTPQPPVPAPTPEVVPADISNVTDAANYATSAPATGDWLLFAFIALLAIFIVGLVLFKIKKKKTLLVVPFAAMLLACNVAIASADTNDFTAKVDQDGSYTINNVNIQNNQQYDIQLDKINFIELLDTQNAHWVLKCDNQVIFDNYSKDKGLDICDFSENNSLKNEGFIIKASETKQLTLSTNVSKQSAIKFIDKQVAKFSLNFKPYNTVNVAFKNWDQTIASDDQIVSKGGCAQAPKTSTPPPHTADWELEGWYTEAGDVFDFTKPITEDTTIFAHYKEPKVDIQTDYSIETFLTKGKIRKPQQGLEMFGNYIFSFEDSGPCAVFEFDKAKGETTIDPIKRFKIGSSRKDNHVNNTEFGSKVYPGEEFPLLYISNGKVGSDIEYLCYVEQISKTGEKDFSSKVVQNIVLDKDSIQNEWREKGYVPIFGAPSWLIDREENALWVFSAYQRTTPAITKANWQNEYIAIKFDIPDYSPSENGDIQTVTLKAQDIKDQVIFPYDVGFTQAGCMKNGKIYYCYGVGTDDKRPPTIRVYDTHTKKISAGYNLLGVIHLEPEDLVIKTDDQGTDWLYLNTNSSPSKGDPDPVIYKFSMPKEH